MTPVAELTIQECIEELERLEKVYAAKREDTVRIRTETLARFKEEGPPEGYEGDADSWAKLQILQNEEAFAEVRAAVGSEGDAREAVTVMARNLASFSPHLAPMPPIGQLWGGGRPDMAMAPELAELYGSRAVSWNAIAHRVANDEHFQPLRDVLANAAGSSPFMALTDTPHDAWATITGGVGTSAGALFRNERRAALDFLVEPPKIIDLIAQGTTGSDTIEYPEMTTWTNAAVEKAEDGEADEATLEWMLRTAPVRDIPVWIPATQNALNDAMGLETIIRTEVPRMIRARLDGQLLNGNGTLPNIRGINNTTGVASIALSGGSRIDKIQRAVTTIYINEGAPNGIVLHPYDAEDLLLEKGAGGQYQRADPASPMPVSIWGLPIVRSQRQTQNTALVGDWSGGARLDIREGITIQATDSHASNFIRWRVAFRARIRAALVVSRPSHFCKVTSF